MSKPSIAQVSEICSASRTMVRELGFMNRNVVGTDLSPSAVHTIVEIGLAGSLSSNDLRSLLLLEKSSVSRLVQSLVRKGLLSESVSKEDGRVKLIELTTLGRQKLAAIDSYAESRISYSLQHLDANDRLTVLHGLRLYSRSLAKGRLNTQ